MESSAVRTNGAVRRAARHMFPHMAPYERLHAWRECHELALAVYGVTKRFPSDERYGLTS
jgi:23S rRNA-intervening sequence protein